MTRTWNQGGRDIRCREMNLLVITGALFLSLLTTLNTTGGSSRFSIGALAAVERLASRVRIPPHQQTGELAI